MHYYTIYTEETPAVRQDYGDLRLEAGYPGSDTIEIVITTRAGAIELRDELLKLYPLEERAPLSEVETRVLAFIQALPHRVHTTFTVAETLGLHARIVRDALLVLETQKLLKLSPPAEVRLPGKVLFEARVVFPQDAR